MHTLIVCILFDTNYKILYNIIMTTEKINNKINAKVKIMSMAWQNEPLSKIMVYAINRNYTDWYKLVTKIRKYQYE